MSTLEAEIAKDLSEPEGDVVSQGERNLGSVCEVIAGQHIPAAEHNTSGVGTPYITGPADFGASTPTISKWTDAPRQFARSSDVLVTVKGAGVGKSNYALDAAIGRQVMALRPLPGLLDQRYLFHWIRSNELALNRLGQGATVPGIGKPDLERFPIPLPPLAEQRRIADILDKADAIRRKRKEAIALTEELLRSAFLDMFGDPVTNPKGWPVKALGELADAASGVTKGKRYDGQTIVTLPYMRVANVQDGHLVLDEIKTITVSEDDGRRYQLRVGDVLLTEGGDPDKLGRGTVWRGEIANCIHQNHIFRVRPGSDVRSEYLSAIIGSERGKRYFLRAAKQTTGIATINMTQLKAFPVLLPPIALQAEYSAFIERAATARATFQRRGDIVDDLFNSLVARAFSGELSS